MMSSPPHITDFSVAPGPEAYGTTAPRSPVSWNARSPPTFAPVPVLTPIEPAMSTGLADTRARTPAIGPDAEVFCTGVVPSKTTRPESVAPAFVWMSATMSSPSTTRGL